MDGNEVRARKHIRQLELLDVVAGHLLGRHKRIRRHDSHVEPGDPPSQHACDMTEANQTDDLAAHFKTWPDLRIVGGADADCAVHFD